MGGVTGTFAGAVSNPTIDTLIQKLFPGIQLFGTETGGGQNDIREINGTTWIATNVLWNPALSAYTQANPAQPSAALTIAPNGTVATQTAPANSPTPIVWTSSGGSAATNSVVPEKPGGRLTLQSGSPVMTGDVTGAGTVYYSPYQGATLPIFGGVTWTQYPFAQLPVTLNGSQQLATNVFDIFAFLSAGVVTVAVGPSWATGGGSNTVRGTATALVQVNGIWVNAAAFTGTLFNGSTAFSAGINQATYLGSFFTTGNGQTAMQFKPNAAAGGSNNVLGLFNAYNQKRVTSLCRDSNTSWTYSLLTWRAADGGAGTGNRITFLDGLQQSPVLSEYQCSGAAGAPGATIRVGQNLDSTSATPNIINVSLVSGATYQVMLRVAENFQAQSGVHFIQAMEESDGVNNNQFNAGSQQGLLVSLDM